MNPTTQHTYLCIDLKSFYASVECVDLERDPLTTRLVVADPDRGRNTICLAVSPAMKAAGVRNRCRVFEIPDGLEYTMATPRMRRYMDVSARINGIYLRHVSPDDLYAYSIDECFIDATPYLKLYGVDARGFAQMLIDAVARETGVPATAGLGPNLFLAKVALDVTAKHARDGIGMLDVKSFRDTLWWHRPITDIWGIGPGIARRLARYGVFDLAGVCAMRPETLRREFGKRADYLIDHAWGLEPCTIAQVHAWKPRGHSMGSGQVFMRNYSAREARTALCEMIDALTLDLAEKGLMCSGIALQVGRAGGSRDDERASGSAQANGAGDATGDEGGGADNPTPYARRRGAGGGRKLGRHTDSPALIKQRMLALYDETVGDDAAVKRLSIALTGLIPAETAQPSLFDDEPEVQRERDLAQASVAVRKRFGKNALLKGTSLLPEATARERNQQIGGHRA